MQPQPLVVDWAPASNENDKILFVFDGGVLPHGALEKATFAGGEIGDARFVEKDEFETYLPGRLARRLRLAVQARDQFRTIYAEHGTEPSQDT